MDLPGWLREAKYSEELCFINLIDLSIEFDSNKFGGTEKSYTRPLYYV